MIRNAALVLVAICIACPMARSFPAPRGEPKTMEEQMVGRWQAITLWGEAPYEFTQYEITPDRKVVITTAGQRVDKLTYHIKKDGQLLVPVLNQDMRVRVHLLIEVRTITTTEMVLDWGRHKNSFVFKRLP